MTATEWLELTVLPVVCSFALGVIAMDVARDRQAYERTEALVVKRLEAALGGCMPKEQIGARAILAWRDDGKLHCTRLEDFTYGMGAKRTASVVPILSVPVAKAATAAPEAALP